jgi:hypothetical protein
MDPDTPPSPNDGLSAFWAELTCPSQLFERRGKRRKVMRVAITYAIASIAIIEFASATFGWFNLPAWAFRLVTLCVILGFPIAVIIAWAFELTPDGIKTTKTARQ